MTMILHSCCYTAFIYFDQFFNGHFFLEFRPRGILRFIISDTFLSLMCFHVVVVLVVVVVVVVCLFCFALCALHLRALLH